MKFFDSAQPQIKPAKKRPPITMVASRAAPVKLKGSILKITAALMIFALNGAALMSVSRTFGYFSDSENSSGNNLNAAALNFDLAAGAWSPGEKLSVGNPVSETIDVVKNPGSLNFQYTASVVITGGDTGFCDALQLQANLGVTTKYTGALAGLNFSPVSIGSSGTDNWTFVVSLPDGSFDSKTCQFKFIFSGWQEDFVWGSGFSNTKELANVLADPLVPESILTELAPPPVGEIASEETFTPTPIETVEPEAAGSSVPADTSNIQTPAGVDEGAILIDSDTETVAANTDTSTDDETGFATEDGIGQTEEIITKIEITTADRQLTIENITPFEENSGAADQTPVADEKPAILEPAIVPKDSNSEPAAPPADNSGSGDGDGSSGSGVAGSDIGINKYIGSMRFD